MAGRGGRSPPRTGLKLLIDMNLSPQWVAAFEDEGFVATHWSRIGPGDADDSEIFDAARERGEIVFTNDLDFGVLLSQTRKGNPSVIQLRTPDVSPEAQARVVISVLKNHEGALVNGAIVTVEPGRARVRILPLD